MNKSAISKKNTLKIDVEERVRLGGVDQWVRIRGTSASHPVMLLIQQGPGFPMLNEVTDASRLWHLEDDFVMVYWDQRGCGKSYSPAIPPESMTMAQLVEDTGELLAILGQRFNTDKIYVTGFSQGGTVAAMTAARYPERVRAVVCSGMDVDFAKAAQIAYDFVVEQAALRENKRALRELRRIGPPPHLDDKTFGTRVKWLANFGGVHRKKTFGGLFGTVLKQLFVSYSLSDIVKTLRGIGFSQRLLLLDQAQMNLFHSLPRLNVPVFMLQGRYDYAAPTEIAEQYYEALLAPRGKQLIWFEESAHNPWYEEPKKFRETLLMVKRSVEDSGK